LADTLSYFASIGAEGVELYHYRCADSDKLNRAIKKEAKAMGFFFTYGSDCHGPGSGKDTIADFAGDFAGWPRTRRARAKTAKAGGSFDGK
jgi:hypothetical protein